MYAELYKEICPMKVADIRLNRRFAVMVSSDKNATRIAANPTLDPEVLITFHTALERILISTVRCRTGYSAALPRTSPFWKGGK
jgi:hypothetical protein